jgi:Protein of unknown function DUF262/Protein of unknown function (DUF1524)
MTAAYMEARTYGVGQLISERRLFRVPDHQRDYAWTEDVVEQFLDDIIRALGDGAPDYFLGLLVLVGPHEPADWEILDGQQRLATATMVYSAIRQWLLGAGLQKDASYIQSQFIGVTELGETSDKPRLTLNITNRKTFRELVVNHCSDDLLEAQRSTAGRFSSDRRLIEAMQTCRRRIAQLARSVGNEPSDQAKTLYQLANYLRDSAKVVCVDVPSTANAYVIFESLNDRGLDLSVLDLVKNHMFGHAGRRLTEVQSDWTRMLTHIGDRQGDDFLKVFWTSRAGRIQRGRLFDEWRAKYDSEAKVVALAEELADTAEEYSAIEVPSHEAWGEYTAACREYLSVLAVLGARQVYPIILAGKRTFDAGRMETLLRHLVTLIVRYQIVGRGRTGALEIHCARVAPQIFNGSINSPAKVWKALADLVSPDDVFKSDFLSFAETKAPRARYFLRQLELVERKRLKRSAELAPAESLTLEHVLPRNPSNNWKGEMGADPDLRSYVNRLGNLCLLEEERGRALGSRAFEEKRGAYKGSALSLTSELASKRFKRWNRESIDRRQKAMADLAVLAWALPT